MSQSDRAIKKLATQLARLDREVKSWRGAQADYTSIEAGTMDINDSDGNLVSRVGFQEDGSGAVRFFDGPVPPVPSGVTASADGPIIQATWDGTFENGAEATYDLAYLEVAATLVADGSNVSFATITAKEGASASVVADVTGDWVVAVRSVSQAGKKSEFATAGTVEVKLTDVAGAIEAVQDSANGKNKVTYSSHAPTENDPGIFDDTWFVGQVGRPNDVIEATNLATNPSMTSLNNTLGPGQISPSSGTATIVTAEWSESGDTALKISPTSSNNTTAADVIERYNFTDGPQYGGRTFTISANFHMESAQSGSLWSNARRIVVRAQETGSSVNQSFALSPQAPNAAGDTRLSVTFTLPAQLDYWYVLFSNGSSSVPVYWDSVDIAEISAPRPYFDGDTEDGATDNESHYRWTGEPHASTSEKYLPALDIGESSNWNIIEQYRHDGNGWVKVELSHYVFSTVDLGKATVGELDGIRIRARTITGDLFSGDAFDGIVFRGNTFVTRDGNGEFSDRGLFFQKPDGTAIFRVPTDGTPISMSASDVQIERAQVDELELNVGRVRSGGLLELTSGVTPPASPPELNSEWKRFATLEPSTNRNYPPHAWENLGYWANGNAWVRTVNIYGASSSEPDKIELFDYTTGAFIRAFNIELNPTDGVTVLGDIVYVLGDVYSSSGVKSKRVKFYNLATGALVGEWEFVNFFAKDQAKVALGTDGTNLVAAGVAPNRSLNVFRYNPSTGAQVGSQWLTAQDWPASGGKDLYAVRINGNDVEVVTSWGARVYLNNNNALVRKTDSANASGYAGWELPAHDVSGCAWVNSLPRPVDSRGNIYAGSIFPSDITLQTCFTWFDGTHETTASPVAEIVNPARTSAIISVPIRDGMQKRVYVKVNAGPWQMSLLGAGESALSLPDALAGSAVNPPTTNSFPNADPAIFRSTNGNVVVRGDGSGKWGPLTFNPDGTMTSTQIPEWVPVTTFKSGYGPRSWGYAPAYRVWPDGKVEWRGIISGDFGATVAETKNPLTIPAAAMPAQIVQFACASTGGGSNLKRVEFGTEGDLTALRVYHGDAPADWVSLDGIYYYLT